MMSSGDTELGGYMPTRSPLWRRYAVIAIQLVAAGAMVAVALTSCTQASHRNSTGSGQRNQRPHNAVRAAAPEYFNQLQPYLSFGWLPPSTTVESGESGTTVQYLSAGQPRVEPAWLLSAYAAGQCIFARLDLRCAGLGQHPDITMTSKLPDIGGLPAFWTGASQTGGILIWQYARGGWARLDFSNSADAVNVADHVGFGATTAPLRFPAQLTGMPGWQLKYARFNPGRGGLLVTDYGFATGAALHAAGPGVPAGYPGVVISDAGVEKLCHFAAGEQTIRTVLAGYQVTVAAGPFKLGGAFHELCAASAGGLSVDVLIAGGHPTVGVTTIFTHLKLLGPDPANWATDPIG
jgi:hypothetical protein